MQRSFDTVSSVKEENMQIIETQYKKIGFYCRVSAFAFVAGCILALSAGAASAAGCGQPRDPGRYTMTLTSGGHQRLFAYFIPSTYTAGTKVPVVFDLHGSNGTADEQLDRSEWERVAEREGFIAVGLQGATPAKREGYFGWNVPGVSKGEVDDEAYIADAMRVVQDNFCVDPGRFYATGYSGGARMISQYLCDGHTDFAAAGLVVGLRAGYPKQQGEGWVPDTATCKPAKPISLIAFAGLEDKVNPVAGQGQPYWGYGADAALKRWVAMNGCQDAPDIGRTGPVETTRYSRCADNVRLVSYRIGNAGHTWPGSTALLKVQNLTGRVSFDLNATDLMWDFFSKSKP
ncbi:polyhydroxybutyrate depolymerase [Agrobacterium vitis]|nr:polyhydroxybutyrate depolymerase [Agrobacterium vitis]